MKRRNNIDRETIRLFWRASLRHRRLLMLALLYPIAAIFLTTITPLLIGKTLGAMVLPNGDPASYIPYLVGAALVGVLSNRFGFVFLLAHQARTMNYLQSLALQTLLRRSVGFHNNNVGGKLVSDAIDFPSAFGQLANAFFINLIPFVVVLAVGVTVIFLESWQLGVLILAMAAFAVGSGYIDSKRRAPIRKRRLAATKAVTGHLADTILNVQTVKTFAHEDHELAENNRLGHNLLNLRLRDWRSAALSGNSRISVLMTLQLVFVILMIYLVEQNPALLGIGIFAFSFTITIGNRLFEINTLMRQVEEALLQASPLTEILLETPEIQDAPGAKPLKTTKGTIALNDVTFRYNDSTVKKDVFSKLNVTIKPGEKIGLVGPSGGGKSTLTRLLLRFEDIDSGEILIDGQNIAHVTQDDLRKAIAYVPQEPLLFHRPIRENIAYGRGDADDKLIRKAAHSAHADTFIDQLPEGYDTVVGERGVKLSGGQRQRIAIARAILKDAPILILDEATSALDSESEVLIQDALWKLMQGRTTLVIAHRLSTIQRMDRIIVLDGGAIVEQGTHRELLKKKGLYAKLWAHQSGGFIED